MPLRANTSNSLELFSPAVRSITASTDLQIRICGKCEPQLQRKQTPTYSYCNFPLSHTFPSELTG
jgi:hypothetical protein